MTLLALQRLPDWPSRLDDYVSACSGIAFAWGRHDCALFAAGAVLAITGTAVPLPAWRDRRAALRVIAKAGGLDVAVSQYLPPLVSPLLAQRGDVLLVRATADGEGPALAVCLGHVWAAPGASTINYGDPSGAVKAWRVG